MAAAETLTSIKEVIPDVGDHLKLDPAVLKGTVFPSGVPECACGADASQFYRPVVMSSRQLPSAQPPGLVPSGLMLHCKMTRRSHTSSKYLPPDLAIAQLADHVCSVPAKTKDGE